MFVNRFVRTAGWCSRSVSAWPCRYRGRRRYGRRHRGHGPTVHHRCQRGQLDGHDHLTHVDPAGRRPPDSATGTVVFDQAGTPLCTATLPSRSCTTGSLAPGNYPDVTGTVLG